MKRERAFSKSILVIIISVALFSVLIFTLMQLNDKKEEKNLLERFAYEHQIGENLEVLLGPERCLTITIICDAGRPRGTMAANWDTCTITMNPADAESLGLTCDAEYNRDYILEMINRRPPIKDRLVCVLEHEYTHLFQDPNKRICERESEAAEKERDCLRNLKSTYCNPAAAGDEKFCTSVNALLYGVLVFLDLQFCLCSDSQITEESCKQCIMGAVFPGTPTSTILALCRTYCRDKPTDPPKCDWINKIVLNTGTKNNQDGQCFGDCNPA